MPASAGQRVGEQRGHRHEDRRQIEEDVGGRHEWKIVRSAREAEHRSGILPRHRQRTKHHRHGEAGESANPPGAVREGREETIGTAAEDEGGAALR